MAPSVGDVAPDFELKDQHGQTVRLSVRDGNLVINGQAVKKAAA